MFKPILAFSLFLLTFSATAEVNLVKVSDRFINEKIGRINAPGTIIAVVKGSDVVNHRVFGKRNVEDDLPVTRNTLFRIGSLTKTFTAAAIVQLREKGLLKLDDNAESYIPELQSLKYPYPNSPKITIRHLLTHSSGLIRHPQPEDQSIEGLIADILYGQSFIQDSGENLWYPGLEYRYSNIGIALLGEIVSRVSGLSAYEFIKQEILAPLGMNHTYWHESELPQELRSYAYDQVNGDWKKRNDWDLEGYSAAGSIYSNIDDLSKWMGLQHMTDPFQSTPILSPFIIAEMHRPQVSYSYGSGVGLIWNTDLIDGKNQIGHNGATGGYRTYFAFDKLNQVGVIVMSSNGDATVTQFGRKLLSKIQRAYADERAKKEFYPTVEKLLPYLQLKVSTGFGNIFEAGLYSYAGSDEGWVEVFKSINSNYGMPLEIDSIDPVDNKLAKVVLRTEKGLLSYDIVIAPNQRLSGLLVIGFDAID